MALPYHGISFRFAKDKDWYLTDDGCAANPVCAHAGNEKGIKIKLQISTRERPILPVHPTPQLEQDYFRFLPFQPAPVSSLAFEEVVAEKIRAASQRSKIRDLHDLSEVVTRPINQSLIRALAVLKLWHSSGPGIDYQQFSARIAKREDYDISDLRNLLRRDQTPDLEAMIGRVTEGFRFLDQLTDTERLLAGDVQRQARREAAALAATVATTL